MLSPSSWRLRIVLSLRLPLPPPSLGRRSSVQLRWALISLICVEDCPLVEVRESHRPLPRELFPQPYELPWRLRRCRFLASISMRLMVEPGIACGISQDGRSLVAEELVVRLGAALYQSGRGSSYSLATISHDLGALDVDEVPSWATGHAPVAITVLVVVGDSSVLLVGQRGWDALHAVWWVALGLAVVVGRSRSLVVGCTGWSVEVVELRRVPVVMSDMDGWPSCGNLASRRGLGYLHLEVLDCVAALLLRRLQEV